MANHNNEHYMKFANEQEFMDYADIPLEDKCLSCGSPLEFAVEQTSLMIDSKKLNFNGLPLLVCFACNKEYFVKQSIESVIYVLRQFKGRSEDQVNVKFKHSNTRYQYCEGYDFKYDYLDYENIPGLLRPQNDGFLTPVYFEKNALVYFLHYPGYIMELKSETYGVIKIGDVFEVAFGINRNDKLVMWLGDLGKLDDKTLTFLKLHNLDSDHQLMDSEFYRGQIRLEWAKPIKEIQIINRRHTLYSLSEKKLGLVLNHLDEEVVYEITSIIKPILFNINEIKPNISCLHKVLIEAVNKQNLREYLVVRTPDDRKYKDYGSIKLYEILLGVVSQDVSKVINIKDTIAPLYLLDDLRTYYFHIISDEDKDRIEKNVVKSLRISCFDDTKELYNALLDRLMNLFEVMVGIIDEK
ncbi:MAG: hypothetical protein PHP11_06055 [Erysipelotrichaceae bacterium]|nr:hypothetical protein [Erysipelotrichaceae bacterium]